MSPSRTVTVTLEASPKIGVRSLRSWMRLSQLWNACTSDLDLKIPQAWSFPERVDQSNIPHSRLNTADPGR